MKYETFIAMVMYTSAYNWVWSQLGLMNLCRIITITHLHPSSTPHIIIYSDLYICIHDQWLHAYACDIHEIHVSWSFHGIQTFHVYTCSILSWLSHGFSFHPLRTGGFHGWFMTDFFHEISMTSYSWATSWIKDVFHGFMQVLSWEAWELVKVFSTMGSGAYHGCVWCEVEGKGYYMQEMIHLHVIKLFIVVIIYELLFCHINCRFSGFAPW